MFSRGILAVQVVCLLLVLRIALSVCKFGKTIEFVQRFPFAFYFSDSLPRNKKAVELFSKFIPKCTCLIQAMAFKVLSSYDSDMKLVIGISKKGQFESHAWVSKNNKVVFGGSDSIIKFTRIIDF